MSRLPAYNHRAWASATQFLTAGSNCGQGIGQLPFTVAGQGAIATDVAEGFTALLPKFTAVYGDPGSLTSTGTAGAVLCARAALAAAEADDTTSSSRLDTLRRTLNTAIERDNEARAEYNAIAQGQIYQAAAAEWMAKSAVMQSIADYNTAVTETLTAQATLDTMNFSGYVPLGNAELVQSVVLILSGMGTPNFAQLTQYVNGDFSNPQFATVSDDGVTDTSDSNFDAAGKPGRADAAGGRCASSHFHRDGRQHRPDQPRQLQDRRQCTAGAQRGKPEHPAAADHRRSRPARRFGGDYYEQQYQRVLADTTNRNPGHRGSAEYAGERSRALFDRVPARRLPERFQQAGSGRGGAEGQGGGARNGHAENVIDAFQNPGSFYEQLVARRQVLKPGADKLVADSSAPSCR